MYEKAKMVLKKIAHVRVATILNEKNRLKFVGFKS